jgi:hypothetical protein
MAVSAPNVAFSDLGFDLRQAIATFDHRTDVEDLHPSAMVKLEDHQITLAAVNTRVIAKVFGYELADWAFGS